MWQIFSAKDMKCETWMFWSCGNRTPGIYKLRQTLLAHHQSDPLLSILDHFHQNFYDKAWWYMTNGPWLIWQPDWQILLVFAMSKDTMIMTSNMSNCPCGNWPAVIICICFNSLGRGFCNPSLRTNIYHFYATDELAVLLGRVIWWRAHWHCLELTQVH